MLGSAEDIEKCKEKDMLEQLLAELADKFPSLSKVFVDERDVYLAHSLKLCSKARISHSGIPYLGISYSGISHSGH